MNRGWGVSPYLKLGPPRPRLLCFLGLHDRRLVRHVDESAHVLSPVLGVLIVQHRGRYEYRCSGCGKLR